MAKYEIEIEGGQLGSDTIEAANLQEACNAAHDWALDGEYGDDGATVAVRVTDLATDEQNEITVVIPASVPACIDSDGYPMPAADEDHDWRQPLAIVGGIKENPGCWGHGGGIVNVECCLRCGAEKRTDTWADNGRGGHEIVTTYTTDKYPTTTEGETR